MNLARIRRGGGAAIFALGSVLACATCLAGQREVDRARTKATFRVAGVVVSDKTGEPLGQARVTLVNTRNAREVYTAVTGDDGHFGFGGLKAVKYTLTGARRGYIPAGYEQHETFFTGIVTGGEWDTENLRLKLMPMAVLTGTVTDESGEGVRSAQVRVYLESHDGGSKQVVQVSGGVTDDQGTFEMTGLRPGKYYAAAIAEPWYATRGPVLTNTGGRPTPESRALDVVYPLTFYGGATDSESAEAIPLQAGDKAQVDIRLTPVPSLHLLYHVSGDGSRGYQLPMFEKEMFGMGGGWSGGMQSWGNTATPGVVEIGGLPPGRYRVRMPESGGEPATEQGEIELNEDGVDLNERKGEALGTVRFSVKMPKDGALPQDLSIGFEDERKRASYGRVDADGKAKFDGLAAGKYGVRAYGTGGAYSVLRMASGDTQVASSQFSLRAGETQEWTVWIAAGKTNIEGFVKRGGKAASGVIVVLIPKEPETHQELFRRDQSDMDGSFVFGNVIPGAYAVAAIEDAWGFDWSKPALLARYAAHGQALTVGELMQGVVSLPQAIEVQPR